MGTSSSLLLSSERIYTHTNQFGSEVDYSNRHFHTSGLGSFTPGSEPRPRNQPDASGDDAGAASKAAVSVMDRIGSDFLFKRVIDALFPDSITNNTKLSLEDYLRVLSNYRKKPIQERIKLMFAVLDIDADGIVSVSDLSELLHQTTKHKFKIGNRVRARNQAVRSPGVLRYLGETEFSQGIWAGIELDEPVGKNNGSVQGIQYFSTDPQRGVFVRINILELESIYKTARSIISNIPSSAPTESGSDNLGVNFDAFCNHVLSMDRVLVDSIAADVLPSALKMSNMSLSSANLLGNELTATEPIKQDKPPKQKKESKKRS